MVGNRSVVKLVASAGRPAPARRGNLVLQRQVLSKLTLAAGPDPVISDLVIGGRTPSPFPGTMGAHSTAWIAHIDEVRRILVGRPLTTGAIKLLELVMARGEETKTRLSFTGQVDQDQQRKIADAERELTNARDELASSLRPTRREDGEKEKEREEEEENEIATSDHDRSIQILAVQRGIQKLIDAYLTYVNYLPGTTVRGGDPRGHGEGPARGTLNQFEYVYGLWRRSKREHEEGDIDVKGIEGPLLNRAIEALRSGAFGDLLKAAVMSNFSPDANSDLKDKLAQDLWTMFAPETPEIFARQLKGVEPAQVLQPLVANFIDTIRRAYPNSFAFTEMEQPQQQAAGLQHAAKEAKVAIPGVELVRNADPAAFRTNAELAEVGPSDIAEGTETFAVTVLLGADGKVGDVIMVGRTPSPFSRTMGSHTTAWVAHLDAVRALCTGQPPADAIDKLTRSAAAALKDPTLEYAGHVDEKHQTWLVAGYNDLQRCLDTTVSGGPHESVAYLEWLIRDYLAFVNFLPMATIEGGGVPGGRTEAGHRALLNAYETIGAGAFAPQQLKRGREHLRTALLGLFDHTGLRHFPPDLAGFREEIDWTGRGFDETHPLSNPFRATPPLEEERKLDLVHRRLLATLGEAYPRAVRDAGDLCPADLGERDVVFSSRRIHASDDESEYTETGGGDAGTDAGERTDQERPLKRRRTSARLKQKSSQPTPKSNVDIEKAIKEL